MSTLVNDSVRSRVANSWHTHIRRFENTIPVATDSERIERAKEDLVQSSIGLNYGAMEAPYIELVSLMGREKSLEFAMGLIELQVALSAQRTTNTSRLGKKAAFDVENFLVPACLSIEAFDSLYTVPHSSITSISDQKAFLTAIQAAAFFSEKPRSHDVYKEALAQFAIDSPNFAFFLAPFDSEYGEFLMDELSATSFLGDVAKHHSAQARITNSFPPSDYCSPVSVPVNTEAAFEI